MVKKQAQYRIQGMNRDIAKSVSNADRAENLFKYAYEIKNMRVLTDTKNNDSLVLVNELGTLRMVINDYLKPFIEDMTVIGVQVIGKYLVLFGICPNMPFKNYILRLHLVNDTFYGVILYSGNLGFDSNYPIESITCYENESIQKVYWTDGLNSPRMINIADTTYTYYTGDTPDSRYDFTPQMTLNEQVTIEKLTSEDTATFPAGTIQYVLTYSNRYAQETNPFYISPLYYNIKNHTNNSELDRGGKVDEICTKPFKIHIRYTDQTFDLIHIYSIQTTEQNNRLVKRVVTLNNVDLLSSIDFYDTGRTGEILDINEIAFLNEKWSLVVQTINHKDNRLFAGNVETTNPKVNDYIKTSFKTLPINYYWDNRGGIERKINLRVTDTDYYPYKTQLDMNSFQMKTFKSNETYRFGVQLQDRTGKWSEVIFINDKKNPLYPHYKFHNGAVKNIDYYYTYAHTSLASTFGEELMEEGFVKIRPVVVFPSWAERETACQGLLCPTVYSTGGRIENAPYAQSSWFTRPNAPVKALPIQTIPKEKHFKDTDFSSEGVTIYDETHGAYNSMFNDLDVGFIAEFRHNAPIPSSDNRNGELYCNDFSNTIATPYGIDWERSKTGSNYYIDQSIVTLHSPELEFDSNLQAYDLNSLKFRVIGIINWTANKADIQLQAGTIANNPIGYKFSTDETFRTIKKPIGSTATTGFQKLNDLGSSGISPNGYKTLISGPFWNDYIYQLNFPTCEGYFTSGSDDFYCYIAGHIVYPFHKDGLNNWDYSDPIAKFSKSLYEYHKVPLDSKLLYNARYSIGNNYYDNSFNLDSDYFNIGDIKLYNGNTLMLNPPENSGISRPITYYGSFNRTINAPTLRKITYRINSYGGGDSTQTFEIAAVEHYLTSCTDGDNIINTDDRNNFRIYYDAYSENPPVKHAYNGMMNKYKRDGLTESVDSLKHKWGFLKRNADRDIGNNWGVNPLYHATNWVTQPAQAWVKMQYNSTNHAVIVINNNGNSQMTLPTIMGLNTPDGFGGEGWHYGSGENFYGRTPNDNTTETYIRPSWIGFNWGKPFWADSLAGGSTSGSSFVQNNINNWICKLIKSYNVDSPQYSDVSCGWSLIGELYRKQNPDTLFGGNSESAIESNIWYIAGESIRLDDVDSNYRINIYWTEGDTYFQRYDHLKTYSPANVQNGIVDVASFMVETRINLDGRCDINRGRNYFGANNTNFNLMNMAYTQDNNMFTGHTSDSHWLDLDRYPNQVIWSTVKNYGEKIDSWCNLSLITTLDFDRDKGVIRKIERFANELIVFQDNAISKINYNQNVQIATSTGTPIQIANSNAIEGKVYLTTNIGTRNKWSIVNTPTGIYFIDYSNIGIYKFNGQGLPVSITDDLGFRSFMIENIQQGLAWNPVNFGDSNNVYGDFVNYYDSVNGDILFINKKNCLAFNEKLNAFTSFYSYEETPYFINFNDMGFFFRDKKIWKEHSYGYCNFFDRPAKDYYVTLLVNPSSHTDKIFDNVEYRSDVFNYEEEYMPNNTFRDIRVWNEYQDSDVVNLEQSGRFFSSGYVSTHIPSNLKKKFRIWRINVPRNAKSRDRIRNPWTYIKLTGGTSKANPRVYKHILHDVVIDYFE